MMLVKAWEWCKEFLTVDIDMSQRWVRGANGQPYAVNLSTCTQYLDRRLLSLSWIELQPLTKEMQLLARQIAALRALIGDCKANAYQCNVPQQQKIQRIYDFVQENIAQLLLVAPVSGSENLSQSVVGAAVTSALPSKGTLQQFALRLQSKLKLLEEMLASKKLENCRFRYSAKDVSASRSTESFDMAFLRLQLTHLFKAIDRLLVAVDSVESYLCYFDSIKQVIHVPLQAILVEAAGLAQHKDQSSVLDEKLTVLQQLESDLQLAKEDECLQRHTEVQRDQTIIAMEMLEMIQSELPVLDMELSLQRIRQTTQQDSHSSYEWLSSDEDLFVHVIRQQSVELFVELVLQTRSAEEVESIFRKYAMALVARLNYVPLSMRQSPTTPPMICKNPLDQPWMQRVEDFDWTRFFALMRCWRDRSQQLTEVESSTEYQLACDRVLSAEEEHVAVGLEIEELLHEMQLSLQRRQQLVLRMHSFKRTFVEVVRSELHHKVVWQ